MDGPDSPIPEPGFLIQSSLYFPSDALAPATIIPAPTPNPLLRKHLRSTSPLSAEKVKLNFFFFIHYYLYIILYILSKNMIYLDYLLNFPNLRSNHQALRYQQIFLLDLLVSGYFLLLLNICAQSSSLLHQAM